jgi:hypothetical protein
MNTKIAFNEFRWSGEGTKSTVPPSLIIGTSTEDLKFNLFTGAKLALSLYTTSTRKTRCKKMILHTITTEVDKVISAAETSSSRDVKQSVTAGFHHKVAQDAVQCDVYMSGYPTDVISLPSSFFL